MQIRVAITSPGGEAERAPEFTKPEISIGRLPSNDVVLPEAGVSSNHARVLLTGGALTILDLDSTNGTFVNDEPLQGPRVLGDGDEVQIGDFVLRFALYGAAAMADVVHAPAAPRARGGTVMDGGGAWPEQPPMMDDLDDHGAGVPDLQRHGSDDLDGPELAVRRSPVLARVPTPAPRPPQPRSEPPRPAVFPRFEARRDVARAEVPAGFEFAPASTEQLVDRLFTAVWLRIADDVLLGAAGIRELAAALLDEALDAAGGALQAQREALRARMLDEMVGDGPLRAVLDGEPNEVLVHGMIRVRVQRAGHVSEGPCPFTCPAALRCFVSRSLGVHYDASTPVVRGSWGAWAVEATWGAGVAAVVSLRRSVLHGAATLEGLVHAGAMSPGMATLLATCTVARYSILVCAAPGASSRGVLAALLAWGAW
jgi:pilus assembly protein CpaF